MYRGLAFVQAVHEEGKVFQRGEGGRGNSSVRVEKGGVDSGVRLREENGLSS